MALAYSYGIGGSRYRGIRDQDGERRSGAALGPAFVLIAVAGLCCGLLTRAMTLWKAPLTSHPWRFIAVAAVGYILPPIVLSGPAATIAWLRLPSQQVCAAATYRMTAANMTLQVRAAPVFAVEVLQAPGSPYTRFLSFDQEQGLKEFCGLRDNQVIGAVAGHVHPRNIGDSGAQSWSAANCTSVPNETLGLVCRLADNPARRIERSTIYGPEMNAA